MSERQIDDAIDEAVRDLMNVDADPAFRARVANRLRKPGPRMFFRSPLMVAVLTVTVVAVGVSLVREMSTSPIQPVSTTSSARTAHGPASAPSLPGDRTESGRAAPPARAVAPRSGRGPTQAIPRGGIVATVAVEPADAGADPDTVAAEIGPSELSSLAPIEMRSIAPAPIRQSEIVVAPLTPMTELVLAPLDPRTQRE